MLSEGWNRFKDDDGRSEGSTTVDEGDNYARFEKDFYEGLCRILRNKFE